MSFWFAFSLVGLISFAIGWLCGAWDRRNVLKLLQKEAHFAQAATDQLQKQLQNERDAVWRSTAVIVRREEEIERLEAVLLERDAELVILRGDNGPEAA